MCLQIKDVSEHKTLANMEFQILDRNLKLLNKQGKYFISTSNHKLPLKENVSNRLGKLEF